MGPIIPDYKSHHESSHQVEPGELGSSPGYSAKSRFDSVLYSFQELILTLIGPHGCFFFPTEVVIL